MAKIFLSHPNRESDVTTTAHGYATYIRKNSRFGVWLDTEHFPKVQIPNENQIKKIIKEGLDQCDIFLGLYFLSKKLSRSRDDTWYTSEQNMAIYRSMPVIQAYLEDSISSPVQKNYNKLYKYHYSKYQSWRADLLDNIKEVAKLNKISY